MNKSSADVEREVEASRSQLDRNVEALKDKMTPGQLLDEAMRTMGGAGQQIGSRFVQQAKQNPMPLAVMGLGVAWLMASNRSSDGSAPEPRAFTDGEGLSDRAGAAADAVKSKAQSAKDQASSALSTARDKLSDGSSSVRESLGEAADKATQLTQRAGQGVSQAFEKEPLLAGVLGFFVGLAAGAALPPTEAEDRLMGHARDRVVEKGKDMAQTGVEEASSAAKAAYAGAKSEFQSDDGGDTADKLAAAVKTGVQNAQNELKPH